MNAETQLSESEEQTPVSGRESKGFRALMRRPLAMISTAAMVTGAVLGVVVLGDLSHTDTAKTTVASSVSKADAKLTAE